MQAQILILKSFGATGLHVWLSQHQSWNILIFLKPNDLLFIAHFYVVKNTIHIVLLMAFLVVDKSLQVNPIMNVETVMTNDSSHLIYDFQISLKY
jgi:hypothetical protein